MTENKVGIQAYSSSTLYGSCHVLGHHEYSMVGVDVFRLSCLLHASCFAEFRHKLLTQCEIEIGLYDIANNSCHCQGCRNRFKKANISVVRLITFSLKSKVPNLWNFCDVHHSSIFFYLTGQVGLGLRLLSIAVVWLSGTKRNAVYQIFRWGISSTLFLILGTFSYSFQYAGYRLIVFNYYRRLEYIGPCYLTHYSLITGSLSQIIFIATNQYSQSISVIYATLAICTKPTNLFYGLFVTELVKKVFRFQVFRFLGILGF